MEHPSSRIRQWRDSMTPLEHQAYLARRRAIARQKRTMVENAPNSNSQPAYQIQPQSLRIYEHESTSSTNIINHSDIESTHIIHMPSSNTEQPPDEMNFTSANTDSEIPQDMQTHHEEVDNNVVQNWQPRRRVRRNYNSARNYHENMGNVGCQLCVPKVCTKCKAKLFQGEKYSLCCSKGKIVLSPIPAPQELINIFSDQTPVGRNFRQNIRAYNHVFAFTSMGVQVDDRINTGRGIYTFRAQGAIYHKIGALLPSEGTRPRFLQAYIYDTEHEIENRMSENQALDRNLVEKIQQLLNEVNPFVHTLRSLGQRQDLPNCKLIIKEQPSDRRQYTLPSVSQVAAVIVGCDDVIDQTGREIIVQTISGHLHNVYDTAGFYDPLQYPLLLPYGTYGWDINSHDDFGNEISCCDYYAYVLQIRRDDNSLLLQGGRLLQQYAVDNYVKIEGHRLRWVRDHQKELRADQYQGLQDSLNGGVNNAGNIGRRTVLPSSFVGSPRDMYQRYQDAMALVQKYGRPDLFITMTCNPNWEEIKNELLPGQTSQDRPDLLARIFHAKFQQLKDDIVEKGVLGKVDAHAYVIEFQKRGLPHVHMLVVLDQNDKLSNPDDYDQIVRAEIPNQDEEPQLYNIVLKHMIHGPCGLHNRHSPCMKNGSCKRKYPKAFAAATIQGNDSYPIYKRRASRSAVPLDRQGNIMVDNGWVIPYNPWLLLRYDCHINVEICGSIKSVKYLYKYVYKGPDRVALEVQRDLECDEIRQYVDARWVCAPEALWKIFKFHMYHIYPSVERLQIHLPNAHRVQFNADQTITSILSDARHAKTALTEFFTLNIRDERARQYLYREIPEHFTWDQQHRKWATRKSKHKRIGRIYTVSPAEGEKFFLRILLNHVRGPTSYKDLLTVDGVVQPSYKQAAERRGLLERDDSIRHCLLEASTIRMPSALRRLFATILVYCEPTGVRRLWDEFYPFMIEDYTSSSSITNVFATNRLLRELRGILVQFNKSISEFDLPEITETSADTSSTIPRCIEEELSINISHEDIQAIERLNNDQKLAYNTIMGAIEQDSDSIFFVDGPGGTGKTYLYRALLTNLRRLGHIGLATATSGIAATILPGGRTAHSRFKLPLSPDASSTCSISKQSDLAKLIEQSKAIIWDEAPMAHRHIFEALDRTFRDLTNMDLPFGGKIMVLGGDFRQLLPVIPKGTKSQLIQASVVKASFWSQVQILKLKQNMRSVNDQQFSEFLLRVGNGEESVQMEDMIKIPDNMIVAWEGEQSINQFISEVFPNLDQHVNNASYMVERAVITPTNEDVDMLNEKIINMFPGTEEIVYSFDSVEDDTRNLYQPEFLNDISIGGLPPHKLTLKKGAPIMLLRNIDPKLGLCNGTRLLCLGCYQNIIDAEILTGQYAGTRVFIPRIPLKSTESARLPFVLTRKQFPVKLSFSLTINKSQGQTIPHVGVYLPNHVFSHGQLYVALSRGVSKETTKVLVKKGSIVGQEGVFTRNVVFKEVLLHSH